MNCVEFFAGGGLQSAGIISSGIEIIEAFELDKTAVKAYKENFKHIITKVDILELKLEDIPTADLYVFSPPCQSFSQAGERKGFDDPRRLLFDRSLDIIMGKRPKFFWIENVVGMMGERNLGSFNKAIKPLRRHYDIYTQVLNAWDYGVPQNRRRLFIVGIRKDLHVDYKFPVPLATDFQTKTVADILIPPRS